MYDGVDREPAGDVPTARRDYRIGRGASAKDKIRVARIRLCIAMTSGCFGSYGIGVFHVADKLWRGTWLQCVFEACRSEWDMGLYNR